ncbi:MAG: bifunctional phosphoglucose/phosphomannose isomerase [Ignavibacteriae bacterium]|nr:bifunctional phosphoglucose/phosphomannose isomerase [Ignavibacteria bacterium]MBI3364395.1 bifunctional phosphoglucose/phosphomannose isomerase [Ignavibacteriota bacterium]
MTESTIARYDTSNMRKLLIEFPKQVEDAVRIGNRAKVRLNRSKIRNIVVTGLGGSAIGGDVLRSYVADQLAVPFIVNRHYVMPEFVDEGSLVVVSSYSGNTEETISAHRDATKRGAQVFCISSNGETARLAKKYRQPLIAIPKKFPPRAALGYSFFPLLVTLANSQFIRSQEKDIAETIELLRKKSVAYRSAGTENIALKIARKLRSKLPITYSAVDRFDSVNLRWRGQLAENAKVLAFGHVVPEMNHNELVGWNVLKQLMQKMVVIFLRDKGDHKRVVLRMDITKELVQRYAADVIEVESEGRSVLARMFSLIYLGDWVSYYLAILNNVDPMPVKVIDYLKNELAKV